MNEGAENPFLEIKQHSDILIRMQSFPERNTSFNKSLKGLKDGDEKYLDTPDIRKCKESLLQKLHFDRKEAFQTISNDIEDLVNRCLKAKSHLQAVEESNRNFKAEVRSLRAKYEDLLEKNKKDTGIIMKLKASESRLKQAITNRKETDDSLLNLRRKNKETSLSRRLLQDERSKALLKSQKNNVTLNKINLRHRQIEAGINEQNKISKEDCERHAQEVEDLRSNIKKNDRLLKDWSEINTQRSAAIRDLQEDMKSGLMVYLEKEEKIVPEEQEEDAAERKEKEQNETIEPEPQQETEQDASNENESASTESSEPQFTRSSHKRDRREELIRREWRRKKTLYEVAERQKEHLMGFYMLLNESLKEVNVEVVCVRQWRIDKAAEMSELIEKTDYMEKRVAQKRRNRPIPPRATSDEFKIWIKVQREAVEILRSIASKCLSMRIQDVDTYSQFQKGVKETFLDILKSEAVAEPEKENKESKIKQE